MNSNSYKTSVFITAFLTTAGLLLSASLTSAQSPTACQPPKQGEYLLLVISETSENQEQIRRTLPPNAQPIICQYLEDTVTRIGGFQRIEDANNWAQYINEIVGLEAYVAKPVSQAIATTSPNYNPQPLGEGYAVLVDYFNQPEVATQIRELLGKDIGLASYGQRPFLLAIHTDNEGRANSTLRKLSDRGFWAMVVDSRRVTLLKPVVTISNIP